MKKQPRRFRTPLRSHKHQWCPLAHKLPGEDSLEQRKWDNMVQALSSKTVPDPVVVPDQRRYPLAASQGLTEWRHIRVPPSALSRFQHRAQQRSLIGTQLDDMGGLRNVEKFHQQASGLICILMSG